MIGQGEKRSLIANSFDHYSTLGFHGRLFYFCTVCGENHSGQKFSFPVESGLIFGIDRIVMRPGLTLSIGQIVECSPVDTEGQTGMYWELSIGPGHLRKYGYIGRQSMGRFIPICVGSTYPFVSK